MNKNERILQRKKEKGSRTDRKLKNYTDNFNEIFNFYLEVYRKGIITFCGSDISVKFNVNAGEAKYVFREYDNGRYKLKTPITRHPNILKAVITGKKGWGLWVKLWTEGILERSFTKEEILNEFALKGIVIPKPFLLEFENNIKRNWK